MTATGSLVVLLPDVGEGLVEAEIIGWLVAVGDAVAIDQPLVEIDTAKAAVMLPSPRAGVIAELHAEVGDTVAVGAPLLSFAGADQRRSEGLKDPLVGFGPGRDSDPRASRPPGSRRRRPPVAATHPAARPADSGRRAIAAPAVRELARSLGVDLRAVHGTGPDGLIVREDVLRANQTGASTPAGRHAAPLHPTAIAKLETSRREIPEVTVWRDVDASGLLAAREELGRLASGTQISLLGLIACICVRALREHPQLNSRFVPETASVVLHDAVHLGIAVQTDRSLVVPVVQDAHLLGVDDLCDRVHDLITRVPTGTLEPTDLSGGTFTLNNYGGLQVDGSTPIINHPQAAILGVGRIMARPWAIDDEVVIRPIVTLALAYDHRVSNGNDAADFLHVVSEGFEAPEWLVSPSG
jgi:pyruvate dehydrogenase E2 component (dihydrolipoamide acetyltransferase)